MKTALKCSILIIKALCAFSWVGVQAQTELPLWPEGVPESTEIQERIGEEQWLEPKSGQREIKRLTNVTQPSLTFYPAPDRNADERRGVILVCPGGGYRILAIEHEGTQVAEWFTKKGIHVAVLKYRVPAREKENPHLVPVEDAQRALGILRAKAQDWGIDESKVGMLGFSAGGNLAWMTALQQGKRNYSFSAEFDVGSAMPDFLVAVYPAYLVDKKEPFELLPKVKPSRPMPPTLFVHAHDDPHASSGSALLYLELKKLKSEAELHIYNHGGHGFGMSTSQDPVMHWPFRAWEWLVRSGLAPPSPSEG